MAGHNRVSIFSPAPQKKTRVGGEEEHVLRMVRWHPMPRVHTAWREREATRFLLLQSLPGFDSCAMTRLPKLLRNRRT